MLNTEIPESTISSMEQRPDYYFHPAITSQMPQVGMNLPVTVPTLPITYPPPPTAWAIPANQELPVCVYPFSFPNEVYSPCEYSRYYSNDNSEANTTQIPTSYAQSYAWQCEPPQAVSVQMMDIQRNFIPAQFYAQQPQFWPPSYANQYYDNQAELQNQCVNWEPVYNPGLCIAPQIPQFHSYNKETNGSTKAHSYRSPNGNKQGKATIKQLTSPESIGEKHMISPTSVNEHAKKEKQEGSKNGKFQGNKDTEINSSFEQKSTKKDDDKALDNYYNDLEELLLSFMPEKEIDNLLYELKNDHESCSYTLLDDVSAQTAEQLKSLLNTLKTTTTLVASTKQLIITLQSTQYINIQLVENKLSNLLIDLIGNVVDILRNILQQAKSEKAMTKSEDNSKVSPQTKKVRQQKRLAKTKKRQDGVSSSSESPSQDRC